MSFLSYDSPLEKIKLDKSTPMPLYYQIERFLRDEIASGALKPGDKIMAETNMQSVFNVSRATVRRAISNLAYEGLLERNYSNGTIVAEPKLEEDLSEAVSFTSSTLKTGANLTTRVLEFFKTHNKEACEKLGIDKDEMLYYINRLRMIDEQPVCVEDCYFPVRLFNGFSCEMMDSAGLGQSLYHVFQHHYNVTVRRVKDTMSAVSLDDGDAKLLNVRRGRPVLLRQRVTYNHDQPVLYSIGRYIIKINIYLPTEM